MYICLAVESMSALLSNEGYEEQYEKGYKALGSILYSNPSIKISLAMNGCALMFLKSKHPEFLYLLRELVCRSQVEIIGGGYYDPVFPLLFARERTSQIDMLTSVITQETGKKPHTAFLYASSWDASLVSPLKANGIDCVLLDSSAVFDKYLVKGIPIVMSDRGKSIDIFPAFCADKIGDIEWSEKNDQCLTFYYTQEELSKAIESGNFIRQYKEYKNNGAILSTITEVKTAVKKRIRAYLSCTISCKLSDEKTIKPLSNIHEYLQCHNESDSLYHRQILVSILIDQYHGDKLRKNTARKYLLSSQCGEYLFHTQRRDLSYEMLNEADNQIHADNESVTALDTDEDGIDEYMCRMEYHTSVISEEDGAVISFDAVTALMRRYSNSLFSDSFSIDNKLYGVKYTLQKFLRSRHEVFFQGEAESKTAIVIRKKYIITSSGFVVQYIIRNDGDGVFDAIFTVKFSFFHIAEEVQSATLEEGSVSAVKLTDIDGGVSFLLEPNENALFTQFQSAENTAEKNILLSWHINIPEKRECEKTISLAMVQKDGIVRTKEKSEDVTGQLSFWDEGTILHLQ